MRARLITMTIMTALFAVGCFSKHEETRVEEDTKDDTVAQYLKPLSKDEKAILQKLKQYEFHELQYLNHKQLQSGDTNAFNTLAHNNSLWITLYETSKTPNGTYGLKSNGFTDEGDLVTTYFVAKNGVVTKTVDYSRDMFAGTGVIEERMEAFFIGYTGYNLPCPCGSGKTWSECHPGQCRRPTFVIVTETFPKDEVLHWIPAPRETEKSMTWKYSPNKPAVSDGK